MHQMMPTMRPPAGCRISLAGEPPRRLVRKPEPYGTVLVYYPPPRGCTMQDSNDNKLDRRTFIGKTAGVVAGSALASTALSYERILGANDRIALGHIGVGSRGSGLHMIASRLKGQYNVETVAVCDLWKNNRERATANSEKYFGRAPKAFQYLDDLLAQKDVDAV